MRLTNAVNAMALAMCLAGGMWPGQIAMLKLDSIVRPLSPLMRSLNDDLGDQLSPIRVDALPPGETDLSLARVRYLSGAEIADQPIDGPRVIILVSGELNVRPALPGAVAYRESAVDMALPLAPSAEFTVEIGTTVVIPAGIPVQLRNASDTDAEWLQFQIETPPTVCPCGEDRSRIESEILSSRTLPNAIPLPATLEISRRLLLPTEEVPAAAPGSVQLVGSVAEDSGSLKDEGDGSTRNQGTSPIEIVVVAISGAPDSETQRQSTPAAYHMTSPPLGERL